MRISEYFELGKTQAELDFVDIDISKDLPLFIDPHFMATRLDAWSQQSTALIRTFFQHLIELFIEDSLEEAWRLFSHLSEPNETCLGLSVGRPRGRGVGKENAKLIFESLVQSKALKSGLVEDFEDQIIFVDGVGKDKLSDMVTNIIRGQLIAYTQAQCTLQGIPLTDGIVSGDLWDPNRLSWQNFHTNMLVINGEKKLLVPKGIVSFCKVHTPQQYHQHFVLNFLQHEHMRLRTAFVEKKFKKDGTFTEHVYKGSLKEGVSPGDKEDLRNFTRKHPSVFKDFKEANASKYKSLSDEQLSPVAIEEVIDHLITRLKSLQPGNADADAYENIITGILELLFYPDLICPQKQVRIHAGRKRIDITFDNAAKTGSLFEFHATHGIPCQYIMVECKNYAVDPANEALDQLGGRFSPNRGKVGIMICRKMDNLPLFMNRCSDTFRDDRGLIIPLTDEDLVAGLLIRRERNLRPLDEILRNRSRSIQLT